MSATPIGPEERAEAARSLARIDAEERELVLDHLDRDVAWRLGMHLREAALADGLAIVVGVALAGQRVFHCALDGANPDNDAWLDRKAAAVLQFHRSSLGVREWFRAAGRDYASDSRLDHARVAANGGVLPLRLRGVGVVGTVGVSGLPQVEDHAFVVAGLRSFLVAERERTAGAP
ncbi:heme-degrading domain-containing protein [Nocardioides zeae]|uniref:Heme-degrading domain-containing protein n=1 Tax=Nocardioides imazamoxiresistens TaxID=3231893 RepID=A0ABU3Q1D6_9ACTN|nr:heme-degrading domain-containing protein [Nocardioides zeae]MDT9595329.1 heme-degrading domain-containing protein [Nocardioides zeae]